MISILHKHLFTEYVPIVKIMLKTQHELIKALRARLLNIGEITAQKLYSLGITTPEGMKNADPKALYEPLQTQTGGHVDRCVLY
jgi:hypothetical protein